MANGLELLEPDASDELEEMVENYDLLTLMDLKTNDINHLVNDALFYLAPMARKGTRIDFLPSRQGLYTSADPKGVFWSCYYLFKYAFRALGTGTKDTSPGPRLEIRTGRSSDRKQSACIEVVCKRSCIPNRNPDSDTKWSPLCINRDMAMDLQHAKRIIEGNRGKLRIITTSLREALTFGMRFQFELPAA